MKKVFTLFTTLTIVAVCNAQFEKGQILFGPSFSFNGRFANIDNSNIVGVPPTGKSNQVNFGIGTEFIKMKTASTGLGFRINYTLHSYKDVGTIDDDKSSQHYFTVGVAKIKFYPIAERWLFYYNTNADLGYSFGKTTNTTINNESKTSRGSLDLSVEPGIAFKLRKNFLIGFKLVDLFSGGYRYQESYNKNNAGQKTTEKESDFYLSTSLTGSLLGSVAFNLKWIL